MEGQYRRLRACLTSHMESGRSQQAVRRGRADVHEPTLRAQAGDRSEVFGCRGRPSLYLILEAEFSIHSPSRGRGKAVALSFP
jgi:hypothetical protein